MTIINAIIMGIVQGIAEFLPISSSGHLSVLQNLFHLSGTDSGRLFFDAMLQFGALISIFVVYGREIARMGREIRWFRQGRGIHTVNARNRRPLPMARLALMLLFASVPLILVLPVRGKVQALYEHTFSIGLFFLLTGCIVFASDQMAPGEHNERNMTVIDALLVGLCQCVAVVPGVSRTGVTISAGIARGLDRGFAVKFSNLLSIPALIGSGVYSLIQAIRAGIDASVIPACMIGTAVSAAVGVFAIRLLRRIVLRGHFGSFCWYLWGAGILTVLLSLLF